MACVYTCVWGLGRVSGREVKRNEGDVPCLVRTYNQSYVHNYVTCITVVHSIPMHIINSYDIMQQVQSGPFDDAVETACTDEDIYWSPSSKEEEIYAQMSRRKYQEIPRDKVKMLTKLGETYE